MNDQMAEDIVADILSSKKNIYINKFSNFFDFVYKKINTASVKYNLYVEGNENIDSLLNLKSNINLDEYDNKKYDLAILSDINSKDLFYVLDKLQVDARCLVLGKFNDELIDIDIYKYIHQKRIEVFFIEKFEIS